MKTLLDFNTTQISSCEEGIKYSLLDGYEKEARRLREELSIHKAYQKQIQKLQKDLQQALARSPWEEYPW